MCSETTKPLPNTAFACNTQLHKGERGVKWAG